MGNWNPLEVREQFAPSPEMIQRTEFESTKRQLRYQVGHVDVPAFVAGTNPIIEYNVSGAVFIYILGATQGQVMMAMDSGDFISIGAGDKIKCSPIEKLKFRRFAGPGTAAIYFVHSNDPLFDFDNSGDFLTRGAWNPAGAS